jgi:Protein of unknown function (DUF1018)
MNARSFGDIARRHVRTSSGKADSRKKLIGAVRAAAHRLQLQDDDRKAIQLEVTGKASMSDMDVRELGLVLDRLNRDQKGGYGSSSAFARSPHAAKVKALWWTCHWLGLNVADDPSDAALDAFVKRQTGLDSIRFLNHLSAPSIIEALKAIAARDGGVIWPLRHQHERAAVLVAIWNKLFDLGKVSGFAPREFVQKRYGEVTTDREFDAAIRDMGKMLRRAMYKSDGEA